MDYHNQNTMHFTHLSIRVKDIDKMLDFYQSVLGFFLNKVNENEYHLGTKNNSFLTLIHNPDLKLKRNDSLYHAAYLLPNRNYLGQFLYSLIKKNIKIGGSNHGFSEALYFSDPEGNGIEVYSDLKGFNIKEETPLFSQRLNYKDLLDHKINDEFKTIPNDTKIGHLHLHVKDLEKATNFYHQILGFDIIFNWNNQAIFLSDNNYHHHIAYNIWDDFSGDNKNYTGLESLSLNIPKQSFPLILEKVKQNGLFLNNKKNIPFIRDVNDTKIFLIVNE